MWMRVAAYGVIVADDSILLAHWNDRGRSGWTLPGGGLDPGEDPADAARREILEETGYTAELREVLGVDSKVIPHASRDNGEEDSMHAIRIVYRAAVSGGDLRDEIGGTTDRAEWFPLGDLNGLRRVDLVDAALRMAGIRTPTRKSPRRRASGS